MSNNDIPDEDERRTANNLWAFVAVLCFAVATISTIRSTKNYFGMAKLENEGSWAKGFIIQRVREPQGRAPTRYYIRYQFENTHATENCYADRETGTTPKYKVCRNTIQKQPVTEVEYSEFSVPQEVDVLYLASPSKTRSIVTGLSYDKTKLRVSIFLSLLGMISSVIFLIKLAFRQAEESIEA